MRVRVLLVAVVVSGCKLKGLALLEDEAGATPAASVAASATAPSASTSAAAAAATVAPVASAAPIAKAATTTAAKKPGVPTCAAGQIMASEALSPLKPFCGAKCKTDADCKVGSCTKANRLESDGSVPKKEEGYVSVCDPEYAKTTPSATASAKTAPSPPKCKASEHYDDIDKKCRPLGDCPKGYSWNDPMQSCIMQ